MEGSEAMGGRPSKPYNVISLEGKSHRTKAELKQREENEQAVLTGVLMKARKEVKENPVALKEFRRISNLLKSIEKNDAIYEAVINRYCLIYAECCDFEEKRESFYRDLEELTEDKDRLVASDDNESGEISLSTYYKMKHNMQQSILGLDKVLQSKRKMLMDIEKENIMTIASALRNIPKSVDKDKPNPLLEALGKAKMG